MEPPTRYLMAAVTIKIDRPMGSSHPEWGFIYPINYGYLPGVPVPDGEELDAYLLGIFEPLEEFTGVCIAILHRLNDDDDKLVVVPDGVTYSDEQIAQWDEADRLTPGERQAILRRLSGGR